MTARRRQPVVAVRSLAKSFGRVHAVDGISFNLYPGEVHGFIGPNGAGKTTTMRIMAGVEYPDSGDVCYAGVSVIDHPDEATRSIGFMPDYLDSYPRILVWEYLDFYARIHGQPPSWRHGRMADVVEFTGLGDMLDRPVEGLSKGWKQRLSLARVLLNDPKVLILDEPAAGLDPRARVELRDLVVLLAENGKSVFISSHILTELAEMCQAVTIIEHGRLVTSGGMDQLQQDVDQGRRMGVSLLEPTPENKARLVRFLAADPGIIEAADQESGAYFIHHGDAAFKADILRRLLAAGFAVTDFHSATTSLEDAFIMMTTGEKGAGA
ncbi:MAG: ABC transporter ATP-binding protein [Planctomycetes bacterium]|nr:ABC transporter ATP-binding protein [Planctomycetota bacterium]